MRRIGLYYPYIHFRNDTWLKAAALYWPKMARIVPVEYQVRDYSEVVRTLNDGLDFLIHVQPDPATASAVSSVFQQVLAEHAEDLRALYQARPGSFFWVSQHDPDRVLRTLLANERLYPPAHSGTSEERDDEEGVAPKPDDPFPQLALTGILRDEVEPALEHRLIQEKIAFIAARERGSHRTWLAVHPQFAWVYKCALTRQVARQNLLQPTTDQIATHSADQEWTADQIADALLSPLGKPAEERSQELHDRIGLLAMRVAIPANLSEVPAKKIVRLREKYGSDFDAFGDLVTTTATELGDSLADVKDPEIFDAYLRQVVKQKFARPLNELKKAMRGVGVDSAFGALNIKLELPAAAALVGGVAAGHPILTGAGVAFGLLSVARSAQQARAQKRPPSAASYLLHVGKLGPESLLSRVVHRSAGISEQGQ
ncbi:DUF6236 family protein [Nonomuraea angiospora]|uniref:DUF6236 family protein n=1 Tax=Nonomuraea angiospora TaxID=46172 RepID=UPI00344DB114